MLIELHVRKGTHGLNEELGRHRGREGKKECVLCGDELVTYCGTVQHIVLSSIRAHILLKLRAWKVVMDILKL